jgi:hypothetical protein
VGETFVALLDGERAKVGTWPEFYARTGVSENTLRNWKAKGVARAELLCEVCRRLNRRPEDLDLPAATAQALGERLGREGWRPAAGPRDALRRRVCSFDAFIGDRTRDFVGRDFVFAELDEFLARTDGTSGYFLIEGEPGIGKSALLASLVDQRRCVHHFNIALQGIHTARQFLESVCAQLILRYNLPYEDLPPDVAENGLFLNRLLHQAGQRLGGEPLLVAIDALDEVDAAGLPASANLLYLPPSLPDRVFVVATARPLADLRLQANRLHSLRLESQSAANLGDARRFVEDRLGLPGIRRWMAERAVDPEQFVAALLERSEGNFMYLHYVLPAIEGGALQAFRLDELPRGLRAYYQGHWRQMRAKAADVFDAAYQPVLCILAAAREAVSAEQVALWKKLEPASVYQVIGAWREFLYEERGPEPPPRYRIYHGTFRDYLHDEVEPGLVPSHRLISEAILERVRQARKRGDAPP